jgi:quercetin dioxygenase-like cupin family protein
MIGRGLFAPGWRWSQSVGPLIGSKTCPLSHIGYVVEGRMGFAMDDGTEFEVRAGEAIHVAPGHDAWTIGDEPCVILEIRSAATFGKAPTRANDNPS